MQKLVIFWHLLEKKTFIKEHPNFVCCQNCVKIQFRAHPYGGFSSLCNSYTELVRIHVCMYNRNEHINSVCMDKRETI